MTSGIGLSACRRRLLARGVVCERIGADLEVAALAIDSRRVRPGALFAALPGSALDGRDFIPQALAAGAVALLLPAGSAPPEGVPALRCERPRLAAALLAQMLAGDPGDALVLLGVTGTNGKSSCAHLLQWLLGVEESWGLMGTLRVETGRRIHAATHTTPDPVGLAEFLAEARAAGCKGIAMEVSSHALAQDRAAGLEFSGALYTNLSRDHLDYHGDMASYLAAKARLLDLRRPGAPALLNGDDPAFVDLFASGATRSYGRNDDSHWRIEAEEHTGAGSRFRLRWPDGAQDCVSPLPGPFNVMNAAGCLGLAIALGGDPRLLAERLAAFPGVPGRMQAIALEGGPAALLDFAHSPDAVARVLAASRPLCRGRLIALLGAGGDRDKGKRPLMAAAAQAGADHVILTSDNPRSEDPAAILADMESGMDASAVNWHKEVDRAAAIRLALELCGPGDMIVLLGKGHETTQEIAGERLPFDDGEVLRAAWRELNGDS